MRGANVYRGVLKEKIILKDEYGLVRQGFKIHYLKPYDKPGPAKGSVTTARKQWGNKLADAWVEVSTQWEKI